MWYVENFFALRAPILKRIYWEKWVIYWKFLALRAYFSKNLRINMEDISQNFCAARAYFLKNVCIKISDTFENFPRCAQLFLKNSLATMDGIIWICKVSKSSTLARLIITYPYLFTKCQHFYVTKNFRWIYFWNLPKQIRAAEIHLHINIVKENFILKTFRYVGIFKNRISYCESFFPFFKLQIKSFGMEALT